MNEITVQNAYNCIDHSSLFYIPFLLAFLKNSYRNYNILEICFYFIFIFDDNYKEFLDGLTLKSNYIKKLRNFHYFKAKNKEKFLEIYYGHFLNMIYLCKKNDIIQIEDGILLLTERGIAMVKKYERKFNSYPSDCYIASILKNVKVLAGIIKENELVNVLEKIGVRSL